MCVWYSGTYLHTGDTMMIHANVATQNIITYSYIVHSTRIFFIVFGLDSQLKYGNMSSYGRKRHISTILVRRFAPAQHPHTGSAASYATNDTNTQILLVVSHSGIDNLIIM